MEMKSYIFHTPLVRNSTCDFCGRSLSGRLDAGSSLSLLSTRVRTSRSRVTANCTVRRQKLLRTHVPSQTVSS